MDMKKHDYKDSCIIKKVPATSDVESEREKRNAELSRFAATQGMVLLENRNNALPLKTTDLHKKLALFGKGVRYTVKGGTGSGDVNQRYVVTMEDGFLNAGYEVITSRWLASYDVEYADGLKKWKEENKDSPAAEALSPYLGSDDVEVTDEDIALAKETGNAIYVISRNSGEGGDRKHIKGDYLLSDNEYNNLKKLGAAFQTVIVLLNVGGIIDTKFFDEIKGLDSLLLISQPGMQVGNAVLDLLTGKITPSGKLTASWANDFYDYPSSKTFDDEALAKQEEIYSDGIYVGYRYFDSFGIKPKYEFGYGKSYTTFDIKLDSIVPAAKQIIITATVTNTGTIYSGKEVVQVYYSAPHGALQQPYQQLAAYAKTNELAPGKHQTITIIYKIEDMSSYHMEDASFILEAGNYIVRIGNSSRNTHIAAIIHIDDVIIIEKESNQIVNKDPINEISSEGFKPYTYSEENSEIMTAKVINIQAIDFITVDHTSVYKDETVITYLLKDQYENATKRFQNKYETIQLVDRKEGLTLKDVIDKAVTLPEFVAHLTAEQLAELVNGTGWFWQNTGVPLIGAESNTVAGAAGDTTNKYIHLGIPNIIMADGPAGIRITRQFTGTDYETGMEQDYYQFSTAWPISTLRAMTWDVEILKEIGKAVGEEMLEFGITLWLAPAMNIQRTPLCGRNFEYYSEDPVLTGQTGAAITLGVQSYQGIGVTIKHFAAHNREAISFGNVIISERALREIYLKGFEIVVKSTQPLSIMTSYNQINGTYCANSYDLCTNIARGEWEFKGLFMTDWGGKADGALCMHAGNDLNMPGGTQKMILDAIDQRIITLGDLQKSAINVLNIIMKSKQMMTLSDENRKGISKNDSSI